MKKIFVIFILFISPPSFADAIYDIEKKLGESVGEAMGTAISLEYLYEFHDCTQQDASDLTNKQKRLLEKHLPIKYKRELQKFPLATKKDQLEKEMREYYLSLKQTKGEKSCDIITDLLWKSWSDSNDNARKYLAQINYILYGFSNSDREKIKEELSPSIASSCITKQFQAPENEKIPPQTIRKYCNCYAEYILNNTTPEALFQLSNESIVTAEMQELINSAWFPCTDKATK